ncbi:MAG: phytanoyl-CoA dioxygenase family protein [Rhodoferax sp.]|nr:phytanoyl-CoA dioxygenase family protein [Rhodoferax sp.]
MSEALAQQYREQGFLVLPGFRSPSAIAELRQRADALIEAFDPAGVHPVFTTREQQRQVDDYFLGSAQTIRCFFEEEAFDAQGQLRQPKARSINKIGHALHDLDPVFDRFSRGADLAALAGVLGLERPLLWQSMVICKQPGIGGEVRWHQDATFFETTPISVTTFWFALEDAHRGNGCLWVQAAGHRGPLRERFVRRGDIATIEALDATPWPELDEAVPVEVAAGTLVVLHGLLPHYSAANRSARSRYAYTLHATDARTIYSPQNWLQRDAGLPPRGFV